MRSTAFVGVAAVEAEAEADSEAEAEALSEALAEADSEADALAEALAEADAEALEELLELLEHATMNSANIAATTVTIRTLTNDDFLIVSLPSRCPKAKREPA